MSDVGEGWRRLEVGERIEEGDQNRWSNGEWREAHSGFIGWQISSPYDPWRRRVPAATADAPPPTPHPWCRDVDRDLAARGSEPHEDTIMHRDLPDAIHRLNGLVAGMAERLAEMERKHNSDAPAAEPSDDAVALGRALCDLRDTRESLAAAHRGIDRITAERRAASRERDEARARVAELETAPRGWLTKEEREAVDAARDYFSDDDHGDAECVFIARVLGQLLMRTGFSAQDAEIERRVSGEVGRG